MEIQSMSELLDKGIHTEDSLKAKPTKAPFGYYGAKLRLSKQIVQLLPPHNAWVEGFCGSAALTFAKKPAPIEVINDLDGEVVNLFKQLRTNSEALCKVISLTPYSRQEFEAARARKPGDQQDTLERARRFLVATMMTVNGTIGGSSRAGFSYSQSYAREGREARVNRWYNLPERLANAVDRLRGIRIENQDACALLRMFSDRPATLVYLDPPYFTKRDHGYMIDAKDQEFHETLLKECRRARCMLLISGYETKLYNKFLSSASGWSKMKINTTTRDTSGIDYSRTEVLWMNRQFRNAKKRNKIPIRLTRKEIAQNKINPIRKS